MCDLQRGQQSWSDVNSGRPIDKNREYIHLYSLQLSSCHDLLHNVTEKTVKFSDKKDIQFSVRAKGMREPAALKSQLTHTAPVNTSESFYMAIIC